MKEGKIPHIDKLIGVPATEPKKREELEAILREKFDHAREKYHHELEKTQSEINLINLAQSAANQIMGKYGRTDVAQITPEHVHIFKKGGVFELTNGWLDKAGHSTLMGDIIMDKEDSDLDFVITFFHELTHAKSFSAAQLIANEDKEELEEYRAGIAMVSRDARVNYFEQINEAIVGLLTQEFFENYLRKNPLFQDEIRAREEAGAPIDTTRQKEVQDLMNYIEKLHEMNKGKYSKEEIMGIFLDAGINGNLLRLARLIEGTFGEGSFRELGRQTGYKLKQ